VPKLKRSALPFGWTRERLLSLSPQEVSRIAGGFIPNQDPAGQQALIQFVTRRARAWSAPSDEVAAATWRAVVGRYIRTKHGSDWTSYKAMARMMLQRASNLYASTAAFAWTGTDHLFPVGVEPADWIRLSALLRNVSGHLDVGLAQEPLPELDTAFHEALILVRTRINIAVERLQIAVAAIEEVRGRPRGSAGAQLSQQLAAIWCRYIGTKPNVSSASGRPSGVFVDYCMLARDLLPEPHRAMMALTPDVIAKACRPRSGGKPDL
jgi:hypothetical protein